MNPITTPNPDDHHGEHARSDNNVELAFEEEKKDCKDLFASNPNWNKAPVCDPKWYIELCDHTLNYEELDELIHEYECFIALHQINVDNIPEDDRRKICQPYYHCAMDIEE
eukprot:873549_1